MINCKRKHLQFLGMILYLTINKECYQKLKKKKKMHRINCIQAELLKNAGPKEVRLIIVIYILPESLV